MSEATFVCSKNYNNEIDTRAVAAAAVAVAIDKRQNKSETNQQQQWQQKLFHRQLRCRNEIDRPTVRKVAQRKEKKKTQEDENKLDQLFICINYTDFIVVVAVVAAMLPRSEIEKQLSQSKRTMRWHLWIAHASRTVILHWDYSVCICRGLIFTWGRSTQRDYRALVISDCVRT